MEADLRRPRHGGRGPDGDAGRLRSPRAGVVARRQVPRVHREPRSERGPDERDGPVGRPGRRDRDRAPADARTWSRAIAGLVPRRQPDRLRRARQRLWGRVELARVDGAGRRRRRPVPDGRDRPQRRPPHRDRHARASLVGRHHVVARWDAAVLHARRRREYADRLDARGRRARAARDAGRARTDRVFARPAGGALGLRRERRADPGGGRGRRDRGRAAAAPSHGPRGPAAPDACARHARALRVRERGRLDGRRLGAAAAGRQDGTGPGGARDPRRPARGLRQRVLPRNAVARRPRLRRRVHEPARQPGLRARRSPRERGTTGAGRTTRI